MANVEHSTLTGSNLHENKGVSAATDNFVATATSGATVWKLLTATSLTGTGNSFGAQLFHIQDQKASGTQGGTFTQGAFQTRTLNTTLTNEIASASLASNQVTLPAGTYYIEGNACGNIVNGHKLKWRNVTDGTDTLIGMNADCVGSATFSYATAYVSGRFTIAGTKTFELQHRCKITRTTDGFGAALSFGVTEVYADVKIWKIL